jgi:hypothetical protein
LKLVHLRKQLNDQVTKTNRKTEQANAFLARKKELEATLNQALQSNAEMIEDRDAWKEDHDTVLKELNDLKAGLDDRGRTTTRKTGPRMSSASREYARMRGIPIDDDDLLKEDFQPQPQTNRPLRQTLGAAGATGQTPGAESFKSTRSVMGAIVPLQRDAIMTNKAVPEPPRFNGKPSDWESWVQKMELKLRSTTFNCLEEGLLYVLGFLTDDAYQLVNPRVPSTYGGAKMDLFTSIDEMLRELKEHYTNRNESGQA